MAGQRRSEPGGHGGGRRAGARRLGLLLTVAVLAACSGDPKGVGPLEPGGDDDQGSGGGNTSAAALVGTWRNVTVIEVPGDIQTWTTTWRFEEDGRCRQTVESESLVESIPRVTERACTYVAGDFEVTVTFIGGGALELEYGFADFSPDRLVLDGFEYERLA